MTSSLQRKILDTGKVNLNEHFPLDKVEILFGNLTFASDRQTQRRSISFENKSTCVSSVLISAGLMIVKSNTRFHMYREHVHSC